MAATVEICESNDDTGEVITHNITNSNYGSTDAVNLVAATYPITPGNNSYEKWHRVHVTAMGGSSSIQDLKFWKSAAAYPTGCTHYTNCGESGNYSAETSFTAPATTTTKTVNAMATSAPSTNNLGIGGSLSGTITAAGYSDYAVHQLRTDGTATAGTTLTLTYRYNEVA
jgi:hypothetical protein